MFHTSQRTEFKLGGPDEALYLPTMRICNLGFTTTTGGASINKAAGVLSCIKRIEILDGNVSLENFVNFNQYVGFREQNRTNNDNLSQSEQLTGKDYGFVNLSDTIVNLNLPSTTTNNVSTTKTGWLSLRDYMAFLSDSNEVPCKVFKDLRVVIEYDNNMSNLCPGSADTFKEIVRPFMVVDEVVNSELKQQRENNYKGVTYRPMESTQLFLPVIAADTSKTYTLTGFNNKTIQRMLMVKAPTTTISTNSYGSLCSVNFLKPSSNLTVNGSQLLPQPIDTIAKELSSVSESWGDCNLVFPYASGDPGLSVGVDIGFNSYVNFDVNSFVRELQLNVSRGFDADGYYSQAINLILYGEVIKNVMVTGSTYTVGYV